MLHVLVEIGIFAGDGFVFIRLCELAVPSKIRLNEEGFRSKTRWFKSKSGLVQVE